MVSDYYCCTNPDTSSKVNDILHERLHSLSAQLVESKQKIAELELQQFEEGAHWSRRGETWQILREFVSFGLPPSLCCEFLCQSVELRNSPTS